MFQDLKSLLANSRVKKTFGKQIEAYEVLEYAKRALKDVCGDVVATNVEPIQYSNKTIVFACLAASFAQEITLNRGPL